MQEFGVNSLAYLFGTMGIPVTPLKPYILHDQVGLWKRFDKVLTFLFLQ